MNLHALDMPDRHEEVVPWLERHLVSLALPDLVAELAAVYGAGRVPRGALNDLIGGGRADILQHGLGVLSREQFRRLLTQPFLLFELQELVLTFGGRHWRALESTTEVRGRVEAEWRAVKAALPGREDAPPAAPAGGPWYRRPWPWALVVLGAAVGFGACFVWLRGWETATQPAPPDPLPAPPALPAVPAPTAWGWNKPGVVAPADSPQAYLNRLADAVEEWNAVAPAANTPDVQARLADRLAELRGGASRMEGAAHPLPLAMGLTLQGKARDWGREIDKLIQLQQDITPKNLLPSVARLVREMADDLRAGRLGR